MAVQRGSGGRRRRSRPVGRRTRALVLQCLYTHDLRGYLDPETVEWLCAEESVSGAARRNAEGMIAGILDDLEQLDSVIQEYAPALPVNLLAIVDRSILRVAIYEMINREQVPSRVIINEATELASEFGSESSARFVNGVLGSALSNAPEIRLIRSTADDRQQ